MLGGKFQWRYARKSAKSISNYWPRSTPSAMVKLRIRRMRPFHSCHAAARLGERPAERGEGDGMVDGDDAGRHARREMQERAGFVKEGCAPFSWRNLASVPAAETDRHRGLSSARNLQKTSANAIWSR
jgi:hypothetical protein